MPPSETQWYMNAALADVTVHFCCLLRFYSLVWIITVSNSSCSGMAFWIEREGERGSNREKRPERLTPVSSLWEAHGTVEYCSSAGEIEGGRWVKEKKKSLCSHRNELDDLRGEGSDGGGVMVVPGGNRHFLPLTIKIRLASTVSTPAPVRHGCGGKGGGTPPWLRVCHVNYGDPTVPFSDCSHWLLKYIHKTLFFFAHTLTNSLFFQV